MIFKLFTADINKLILSSRNIKTGKRPKVKPKFYILVIGTTVCKTSVVKAVIAAIVVIGQSYRRIIALVLDGCHSHASVILAGYAEFRRSCASCDRLQLLAVLLENGPVHGHSTAVLLRPADQILLGIG